MATVSDDPHYLEVKEVAALLRVHAETVKKWCYRGRLPYTKAGSRIRIKRADLEAFLERCRTGQEARA